MTIVTAASSQGKSPTDVITGFLLQPLNDRRGCRKTTLLRILAGLEHPDQGHITLNGLEVTNQHSSKRRVGFVFQHCALFRHMTVADKVAFSHGTLLEMVQMQAMADCYPAQLSGATATGRARQSDGGRAEAVAARRTVWRARCESSKGAAALASTAA